jgi:hypothetical protein
MTTNCWYGWMADSRLGMSLLKRLTTFRNEGLLAMSFRFSLLS